MTNGQSHATTSTSCLAPVAGLRPIWPGAHLYADHVKAEAGVQVHAAAGSADTHLWLLSLKALAASKVIIES
jgi:hypothetical protein